MNKKVNFICCIILSVLIISYARYDSFAAEKDLPVAPTGYSWKWCENMKAGFLLPDGWYFKEEKKGETKAIFITKESIDKEIVYKTGLSVNAMRKTSEKTGMPPSKFAERSITNMKAITQSCEIKPVASTIYFKGYGGFFRSKTPIGIIIQYTLFMANDRTGTLYMITFESPETEWDKAWKVGRPIIDNLALDIEY